MSDSLGVGAQYLRSCNIPDLVNEMMKKLIQEQPACPVDAMKAFLSTVDASKYKPGAGSIETTAGNTPAKEDAPAEDEEGDMFSLSALGDDLEPAVKKALGEGKTRLDLSKNTMKNIPECLVGNQEVEALSVEENQMENMEKLLTLTNLKVLNISDNSAFRDLPEGFAAKLPKLEKIDAYKCTFSGELSNELAKLKHLTYINFYNNSLLKAPSQIGQMEELVELNLASNKIMAIQPDAFAKLQKLRRLALFWNRLLRIPSLAPLKSLKELQLNGNQLPEMPELGEHLALESINLSENKMTTLHPSLFKQPALEEFAAGKNQLTNETVLSGWSALTTLRKIQMPNNELTSIPREWLELPNLVCLELNGNKIAALPDDVDKAENKAAPLKFLFLAENELTTLPPAMANMKSLVRLAFKGCPLDLSDPDTKTTYETLEAIVKSKGADGKFIDSKRSGPASPPRPQGPTSLGLDNGLAGGPACGEKKAKKKSQEGMPTGGEISLSIN